MGFFSILKNLLTPLLYKLGLGKPPEEVIVEPVAKPVVSHPKGTHGKLDAPAVLLQEDDRIALVVKHNFGDVPSWVEWDLHTGKVNVVQTDGAVAELALDLPASARSDFEKVKRLTLITGENEEKLVHFISFIIRE